MKKLIAALLVVAYWVVFLWLAYSVPDQIARAEEIAEPITALQQSIFNASLFVTTYWVYAAALGLAFTVVMILVGWLPTRRDGSSERK